MIHPRLFLLPALVSAFAAMAQTLSPLVQKPIDEYERYREALMKDAEAKIAARRDALLRELEVQMAAETRAGNLSAALALKTKIEEFKPTGAATATAGSQNGNPRAEMARGKTGRIDFEQKLAGFRTLSPNGTVLAGSAHSGRLGLHVVDPAGKMQMYGPLMNLAPDKPFNAQVWARVTSGRIVVGISCYDTGGNFIGAAGNVTIAASDGAWKSFQFPAKTPPGTNRGSFWIKGIPGTAVTADLDDFALDPGQ